MELPVLNTLKEKHPLPNNWNIAEECENVLEISGLQLHLSGIVATNNQQNAIGSAGSLSEETKHRSYFELLERVSILEAQKSSSFIAYNKKRTFQQEVSLEVAFPTSPTPEKWQYAKSNGVALSSSFEEACDRAHLELIERDLILRSWYQQISPKKVELNSQLTPLKELGQLEQFSFSTTTDHFVHGVFLFPESANKPFVYGMGAGFSPDVASSKASSEFIQRLGFLWEDEVLAEEPEFSPTPFYHQEFYLHQNRAKTIKKWLNASSSKSLVPCQENKEDVLFVDLTPSFLKEGLFVVKALSQSRTPLTFGDCDELGFPQGLLRHPIA